MSEAKKKAAKLGQDKMDDVRGGIPYEDPAIINIGEPVIPGEPGEPIPVGAPDPNSKCWEGSINLGSGGCFPGGFNGGGGCLEGGSNMEN